MADLVKSYKQH